MQLALIIYGSLEAVSGGYLYDRQLVAHLQRCGDTVEIVSLPPRGYPDCLGDNWDRSLLWRLSQLNCHVLLQDELNHPSLFRLNRSLRPLVHYPIVSIVHHLRSSERRPAWENSLYRWVERRYLAGVDGFIFNSQTTLRAVDAAAGLRGRPHVVALPAGDQFAPTSQADSDRSGGAQMDDETIARRARSAGPLRILFLGNLIPRKGLHILLEAISRLPSQTASLTVVGSLQSDPAYVAAIQRQIERLRLLQSVRLVGSLTGQALAGLLAEQQVLVVPSSYEGYGIAYLEGMSAGLPAIATTAGAAGEIITDGQDGFRVPPEDPAALAACLESLASDRQQLERMGQAARQRYLAQPTWEQTAAQIRAFLVTLVG